MSRRKWEFCVFCVWKSVSPYQFACTSVTVRRALDATWDDASEAGFIEAGLGARKTLTLSLSPSNGEREKGCFHCGEICRDASLARGEKLFCCHGYLTVHDLLAENGLGQFYDLSERPVCPSARLRSVSSGPISMNRRCNRSCSILPIAKSAASRSKFQRSIALLAFGCWKICFVCTQGSESHR